MCVNGVFSLSGADKEALKSGLSDMEYLRSKVAQTEGAAVEKNNDDEDEDAEDKPAAVQQTDGAYESRDTDCIQRATAPASSLHQSQGKPGKQQEVGQTPNL